MRTKVHMDSHTALLCVNGNKNQIYSTLMLRSIAIVVGCLRIKIV